MTSQMQLTLLRSANVCGTSRWLLSVESDYRNFFSFWVLRLNLEIRSFRKHNASRMILLEVLFRSSLLFRRNSLSYVLGKIIHNQNISKYTKKSGEGRVRVASDEPYKWLRTMLFRSFTDMATAMKSHTIWLMTPQPCNKKDLQKMNHDYHCTYTGGPWP